MVRAPLSGFYGELKGCLSSLPGVVIYPATQDRIRAKIRGRLFAKIYFRQTMLRIALRGGDLIESPRIQPDRKKGWGSIRFVAGERVDDETKSLIRRLHQSLLGQDTQ